MIFEFSYLSFFFVIVSKEQDWVCSCGQKNFSHNDTECSNCKKGKSSQRNKLKIDKYARADDWKCKNCGYVSNFASNTYCYKCKKLKETRNAGYHNEYVGSSLGYEISNFRDVNHTKSYLKTEKTAESGKKLQKSEYFTKCEPISLHVNYYPINLDKLVNAVYMYEILYKPNQNGVVTKVTSIIAVKTFMTNWFKGIDYAYDGCKIIYTNKKLNLDSMYLYDINIEIRFIKEVDMSKLKTLGEEEDFSKQIQALNIIVCKVFTEMILFDNVAKCGSHIYTPKYSVILHDRFDKLMPYELWYGFIQSVIVKKKATYLNVDVTEKVFTRGVNLLEFFHYYNSNKKVIIKHLNKLVIVYQGNAYHFKKFVSSDDEIYINDYGYITYNEIGNDPLIHLDLYQLPVPVSQCYILSGQLISKMTSEIKFAWNRHFLTDEDRKKKIQELFGRISYNEVLSNFGIMIRNEFEKVEGFIIAPPKLRFAYGEVVDPVNGKWMSKFLLKPAEGFIKWAVIKCVATIDENHLQHFYQLLDLQSKMQNISFEESPTLEFKARESDKFFEALRQQLQLCKEIKCHIVFIILNKNDERYNEIKVIADTEVGILTQCVVAAKVVKVNTVIINGLIHKVNAKLNGINREIVDEIFEEHKRTMFIGADVSHGGPAKIPSIVGVTSSFDTRGFKFYPTWRMQCKENGSGRGMQLEEMILDLENVAKDHLRNYLKYNNEAPDKIIYYRDGE